MKSRNGASAQGRDTLNDHQPEIPSLHGVITLVALAPFRLIFGFTVSGIFQIL